MSARAVREEHEDLQKELETVQLSVEAAKADVATAQRELRTLRDKVSLGPSQQCFVSITTGGQLGMNASSPPLRWGSRFRCGHCSKKAAHLHKKMCLTPVAELCCQPSKCNKLHTRQMLPHHLCHEGLPPLWLLLKESCWPSEIRCAYLRIVMFMLIKSSHADIK